MELHLSANDVIKFIIDYGIDPYEMCPCGSGRKYKWCCKQNIKECKNTNELRALYHKLKIDVWNRNKWKPHNCHWKGCKEKAQYCHSIQNNRFLNQISGVRKEVYHFIPMGTMGKEEVRLKDETISFASTFEGFCNRHDRELFAIIEGNNEIIYSLEQLYAFVYRNFYYMLYKHEIMQEIVISASLRSMPKYYQKNFRPKRKEQFELAVDKIVELREKQMSYEQMQQITSDIALNYDEDTKCWRIKDETLIFSKIRTVTVKNAFFCFQTVREYLLKNEFEQMYKNPSIEILNDRRYNYISTIILPNTKTSEITIFFAISKRHKTKSPLEFIKYINKCTDKELINITNNIVLDAYEELYISKSRLYDMFTHEEQVTIQNIFTHKTFGKSHVTLLDDILSKSKFDFINLA